MGKHNSICSHLNTTEIQIKHDTIKIIICYKDSVNVQSFGTIDTQVKQYINIGR